MRARSCIRPSFVHAMSFNLGRGQLMEKERRQLPTTEDAVA